MSKFRNIKVRVPTPEISEAVHRKLFEDGAYAYTTFKDVFMCGFIFIGPDGRINFTHSEKLWKGSAFKEVHYQSILDPHYDIKIAWANGEVVQYRPLIMDDNGKLSFGDWKDWESKRDICLRSGEHWRVKPKTKTIKQWEQKYYDQKSGLVKTYAVKDSPHFVWKEWVLIGEAYEAEYEVPND